MWEQSKEYNDSWQQDLQRAGRLQVVQDHNNTNITMAVDVDIAKAIDICVHDYIANGGNVAGGNVVRKRHFHQR